MVLMFGQKITAKKAIQAIYSLQKMDNIWIFLTCVYGRVKRFDKKNSSFLNFAIQNRYYYVYFT